MSRIRSCGTRADQPSRPYPRRRIPGEPSPCGRSHHPSRSTPSASESRIAAEGSVFWLPDQSSLHAFPTPNGISGFDVQLVPGYSDGLAPDFHRLPAGPFRFVPTQFFRCSKSELRHPNRVWAIRSVPVLVRASLDLRPKYTLHRRWSLRISPPLSQPQRTGSFPLRRRLRCWASRRVRRVTETRGKP